MFAKLRRSKNVHCVLVDISTTTKRFGMTIGAAIHVHLRMNCKNFSDLSDFRLAASSGQKTIQILTASNQIITFLALISKHYHANTLN